MEVRDVEVELKRLGGTSKAFYNRYYKKGYKGVLGPL